MYKSLPTAAATINEGAYVSQDQLREVYARAMPNLLVNGNSKNHAQIEKLEQAPIEAEKKIGIQSTELETLRKEVAASNAENRTLLQATKTELKKYVEQHFSTMETLLKEEREKSEKK